VNSLKGLHQHYYQGSEDGPLLLQAVRLIANEQLNEAAHLLLRHPAVLANCTGRGGTNHIRQYLLQRLSLVEAAFQLHAQVEK
jgi:hypothetical protein